MLETRTGEKNTGDLKILPSGALRVSMLAAGLALAACSESGTETESVETASPETDLVWAVNVGGPAYDGVDGTSYEAESSVSGGTIGEMEQVKGSQDPTLYQTYREGDIRVARAIENGSYDLTFHFAEPDPEREYRPGERVFDAFAEDRIVIDDIDVATFRDGKPISALTVTVPNVEVSDGELNIRFEASADQPTLSALVVRDKRRPAPDWQLVWSDEFDGDDWDRDKWTPELWGPRRVNDEDQAYTGRPENVRIEDGMLVIEAHREDYEDANYTSARMVSMDSGDFLYGRFEIRAKLPSGQGTWPAIWMLPSEPFAYATTCEGISRWEWQGSPDCDAWPKSGEIDIMEHVGYQMNHVHGTVHNEAYYWVNWEQRKARILLDDVDTNFHVYELEWYPDRIDAFVDGTLYFTYMNEGTGWEAWPYDIPYHLILNIAVGGYWGRAGGPIDDSVFPQHMLIDYVRVYQLPE
ncbi:MAG: family 16 glycosylhydrolase [Woeseiaceae bacterium]|nr:family 16 glycosylhydrolase [Woeseiaceae bacterium]